MSDLDQSDLAMTDSEISHTSTDTEDGSLDSCDDLNASVVDTDIDIIWSIDLPQLVGSSQDFLQTLCP